MTEMIKVRGWSIETREIEIEKATYETAKRDDTLDQQLDVWLSDMSGETFVIEPDGTAINPYPGTVDQVVISASEIVEMLKPLLDALPSYAVRAYAQDRFGVA